MLNKVYMVKREGKYSVFIKNYGKDDLCVLYNTNLMFANRILKAYKSITYTDAGIIDHDKEE